MDDTLRFHSSTWSMIRSSALSSLSRIYQIYKYSLQYRISCVIFVMGMKEELHIYTNILSFVAIAFANVLWVAGWVREMALQPKTLFSLFSFHLLYWWERLWHNWAEHKHTHDWIFNSTTRTFSRWWRRRYDLRHLWHRLSVCMYILE